MTEEVFIALMFSSKEELAQQLQAGSPHASFIEERLRSLDEDLFDIGL